MPSNRLKNRVSQRRARVIQVVKVVQSGKVVEALAN